MKSGTIASLIVSVFLIGNMTMPANAAPKTLMAYYLPWYESKPVRGTWGWHWTMDHFNPDNMSTSGERQIASWYYPLIGPYDSTDPALLEYHVTLMKLSGIDGVTVDWYGKEQFLDYQTNNEAMAALFKYTRKAGLKFCVAYEDQTIEHMIAGKFIAPDTAISHAQQEMLYLQTNYFSDPSFLRWQDRPVVLNFGPQYFKQNNDWQAIFSVLDVSNRPAFFTEDNYLPVGAGAFSWPPMWLSQMPGTGGVLSEAALKSYLAGFNQRSATWPTYMSSAFPRFHDIYQKAGARDFLGYLGDRQGETFRETLRCAMTNSSSIVQIVTWNDFGEGTVVEPTREYGYRDLGVIQDFCRQYVNTNFPYHTNDLTIAARLYYLRHSYGSNVSISNRLDQVFSNIISGNLISAQAEVTKMESELTNHFNVPNFGHGN